MTRCHLAVLIAVLTVCTACQTKPRRKPEAARPGPAKPVPVAPTYDRLQRAAFNRAAVRENLPLFWIADSNRNNTIDPDETAALLFYSSERHWVENGRFTADFQAAYEQLVDSVRAPAMSGTPEEMERRRLVGQDLDQGRATLVLSDLGGVSSDDKVFVGHLLEVARLIDNLYDRQTGAAPLAARLPDDAASQSLFRRNRGPRCVGPATEKNPACSAITGAPRPIVDVYPAAMQEDPEFCRTLEKHRDAQKLLTPFTVVRETAPGKLAAVSYAEAYKEEVTAIAARLTAAADSVKDPAEAPLVAYLRAAAASFTSNNWVPADEAWASMTVENSRWYVRVAPDEVYWEPCAHKAGFHLTFARINQGSLEWQRKLVPVQQEMEALVATRAGKPYKARKVSFHLPDFIDIVVNAGDDRGPLGATIGQSLPNWGPVANQGRGRTVAMSNLYTDPDSQSARHAQADSVLDAASAAPYVDDLEPGLLATILHEACHNLGPAHEYKVSGKVDDTLFGGQLAAVMEELKAQTCGLFLVELLRQKGLVSDELARQNYVDSIVWAFGHISQGMYTGSGERKTYGNVGAIQIGFLLDHGALAWAPGALAANSKDKGAFIIQYDKLVPAIDEMMKAVGGIKARGDRKAAEELSARYVDGSTVVNHAVIAERFLRFPRASFVYAVVL